MAGDAIEVRTKDRIVQGDWYQVAVSYDGTGSSRGIHVYLNGKPAETVVSATR